MGRRVVVEGEFWDSGSTRGEILWVCGIIKSILGIRKRVEGLTGGSEMLQ